jgi:hypothetical protein
MSIRPDPDKIRKAGRVARNLVPVVVRRQFHRPPILIGGCARSGTTLLLSILSSHPGIFVVPFETKCFSARGRIVPDPEAPFRIGRFYRLLLSCEIPRSAHRWCEKSTKNVLTFGRIIDHFQGRVRLIHLVRDGRDVVTSRHPIDPSRFWVPPQRWIHDVSAGSVWEDHQAVLTVRYEDLVTDLDAQLSRLGDFLGEDFSTASETWHERATLRHSKNWFHDLLLPHSESIGRWQDPVHRTVVDELMAMPEAIRLLDRYGYVTRAVAKRE